MLSMLSTFGVSEQSGTMLLNLLETEGDYQKVQKVMKTLTKSKGQV